MRFLMDLRVAGIGVCCAFILLWLGLQAVKSFGTDISSGPVAAAALFSAMLFGFLAALRMCRENPK